MIQAISPISSYSDPEYLRIIQELRRLGISPSGNKTVDKAKLEQAKTELITKIKEKEQVETKSDIQVQVIDPADEIQYAQRAEMEEQRLGAMTVAQLNRIYFNL